MTRASNQAVRCGLAGAALLAALAWPLAAGAQISAAEVEAEIAETYEVKVLKVAEGELDGQDVWLVTVMKPGGDSNDAFQVSTIAVDRQSGALVPVYRQRSSGVERGQSIDGSDKVGLRPDAIRSRTWR